MKILMIFFILLTVFSDFSLGYSSTVENIGNCNLTLECESVDLHNETNKEHTQKNHKHHCHCHMGHVHSAITYRTCGVQKSVIISSFIRFPYYRLKNIQSYFPQINRPPIV